jgi:hypothetical protein
MVTRTDTDGVYVMIQAILPGIELGPLPAIVHRTKVSPQEFSTYKAGDVVRVIEDTPNDFIVTGIVG